MEGVGFEEQEKRLGLRRKGKMDADEKKLLLENNLAMGMDDSYHSGDLPELCPRSGSIKPHSEHRWFAFS